jgi:hypothetical protein
LTQANNQLHTLLPGANGAAPLVNQKMEKRRQRQAAKLTAEQSPNTQANEARSFADIKMDMQELEVRFREQVLDEEFEENGQFDPAEGDPYYSDEEIHGYSGSYAQNHNRPSTLLSNSTVPEETDDPVSKQSEEPRHFGGRYDVPFGPVLRAPVDLNGAARIFGRVSRKPWKPSDPFSSISSTISKDNTGGECARQAKLFADFGQKMKTKPCEFGSAHIEEDMLLEDVYPEVPLTFEGGRSTHIGRGTPNNGFSISDEVKLHGGLTKNGRPAELVRVTKNGKAFSVGTQPQQRPPRGFFNTESQRPIIQANVVSQRARIVAQTAELERQQALRLEQQRQQQAQQLTHRERHFLKQENDMPNLHQFEQYRKCSVESCKCHEYGWPTEKEQDRHYNDKHSASATELAQYTRRIAQRQREESNGGERFLRR